MYNQFCKNLKNFINVMGYCNEGKRTRVKNAEALLPLTDIKKYNEYKNNSDKEYIRTANLVYDISLNSHNNPTLKRFVWELWAYGFDIEQPKEPINRNYEIDEVVKITDLMLSTHFLFINDRLSES